MASHRLPVFTHSAYHREQRSANQSSGGPLHQEHEDQEEESQAGGGEPHLPDAAHEEEQGGRARYRHAGDDEDAGDDDEEGDRLGRRRLFFHYSLDGIIAPRRSSIKRAAMRAVTPAGSYAGQTSQTSKATIRVRWARRRSASFRW